ncbi:MAG: glycosyltransferase [Gammaproteobacteria bacterium]|nr:glycosyltransferase [Gammaproteobacteria bacterium]
MHAAIYVQHLLGSGHLVRMRLLASALHAAGSRITLISGGSFPGDAEYEVIRLPVLKTRPGDFLTLLDHDERPVDDDWKAARRDRLVACLEALRPDLLILETWPFGRRQLEFEILPMLDCVTGWSRPPLLVTSIRDVLQQRTRVRRMETLDRIRQFLSLVLIHGDPALVDLSSSFPEHGDIACPIRYTGYMDHGTNQQQSPEGRDEVIVSAGGGAVGDHLLATAAEAALEQTERRWRILVGPRVPEARLRDWHSLLCDRLVVEPNRADFSAMLTHCHVSVSQFGYNTAVDLLRANCPSVVVPYESDGETEQETRARIFAGKGRVRVLRETDLSAGTLLDEVTRASKDARARDFPKVQLNGAENSVGILQRLHQRMRP